MKKKTLDKIQEAAGLKIDPDGRQLYGVYNGYHVRLVFMNASYCRSQSSIYMICFSLSRQGRLPVKEEIKTIAKGYRGLHNSIHLHGSSTAFWLSPGLTVDKTVEKIRRALDYLTGELSHRGFQDCCENCGRESGMEYHHLGNKYQLLCPECTTRQKNESAQKACREELKAETVIGGVIGAFSGSLIGGLAIILFGQLGYIAAVSGLVMGFCTLKGYRLLGNRLSRKGIIISCAMMILMVYAANRFGWSITLARATGGEMDVFTSFQHFSGLLNKGDLNAATYWRDLVGTYVFTLIGAVPTVLNTINTDRHAITGNVRIYKMVNRMANFVATLLIARIVIHLVNHGLTLQVHTWTDPMAWIVSIGFALIGYYAYWYRHL